MLCTYCTTGRFTIKASPAFLLHKTKFNFKLVLAIVLWYIMKVFANFQNKILILRSLWFCKNENFAPRGRNCRFFGIYFLKIYLIDRNVYVETSAKSLHPTEGHWPGPSILWRSRHISLIFSKDKILEKTFDDGSTKLWWPLLSMSMQYIFRTFHQPTFGIRCRTWQFWTVLCRAGNSLIGFLSELLVFCEKISEWAIRSKKRPIPSFAHFWWATWAICSWLLFAHQKWIAHFLNKKPI